MFQEEIRLDNTRRSTFRECMRKGYWQYVLDYKPKMGSTALRFGSTWHGMQDGFYSSIKEFGWERRDQAIESGILKGKAVWDKESEAQEFYIDYRNLQTASDCFLQYVQHYSHDEEILKVIQTEQVFRCPITLVTEEEKRLYGHLPPIVFTGRLDLQVELNVMPWIIEHKTTGQPLEKQAYQLNRSAQIMGYSYAGPNILDFRPEGCLISFLYASARKNKDGVYGKNTIDFKRVPQLFSEGDFREWRASFLKVCHDLVWAEQNNVWEMAHDQCYKQWGACDYVRLCEQNRPFDETNFEGFIQIPWDVENGEED
jgi:hypothetical protein